MQTRKFVWTAVCGVAAVAIVVVVCGVVALVPTIHIDVTAPYLGFSFAPATNPAEDRVELLRQVRAPRMRIWVDTMDLEVEQMSDINGDVVAGAELRIKSRGQQSWILLDAENDRDENDRDAENDWDAENDRDAVKKELELDSVQVPRASQIQLRADGPEHDLDVRVTTATQPGEQQGIDAGLHIPAGATRMVLHDCDVFVVAPGADSETAVRLSDEVQHELTFVATGTIAQLRSRRFRVRLHARHGGTPTDAAGADQVLAEQLSVRRVGLLEFDADRRPMPIIAGQVQINRDPDRSFDVSSGFIKVAEGPWELGAVAWSDRGLKLQLAGESSELAVGKSLELTKNIVPSVLVLLSEVEEVQVCAAVVVTLFGMVIAVLHYRKDRKGKGDAS